MYQFLNKGEVFISHSCFVQESRVEVSLPQRRTKDYTKVSQRKKLLFMDIEKIFKTVLDCSFQVHTALGPGLLESTYEECLFYELLQSSLNE